MGMHPHQSGYRPRIVEDALVLFTGHSFGSEPLNRTPRGDFVFSESAKTKTVPPKFSGPFPKNDARDIAELAMEVRRHGGVSDLRVHAAPARTEEVVSGRTQFANLRAQIDAAGLHDSNGRGFALVERCQPFPSRRAHDRAWGGRSGRQSIIAKIAHSGLPGSCAQAMPAPDASAALV